MANVLSFFADKLKKKKKRTKGQTDRAKTVCPRSNDAGA